MANQTLNAIMFFSLPEELILYILLIMPLQEFITHNTISKDQNKTIQRIIDKYPTFWRDKAKLSLFEEQLHVTQNYKALLMARHFLKSSMKKQIDLKLNPFIRKKKGILYFPTFHEMYEIENEKRSISFSLDTVASHLMEDNPEKLFAIFDPINRLAASFQCENKTKIEIKDIIRRNVDALNIFSNNQIRLIELNFIGFIPFIMKAGAVRCFDLFIRAYLTLVVGTFSNILENSVLKITPSYLFTMVFSSSDDYFKKELVSLALKIIPGDDAILYELFQFCEKRNAFTFVKESLGCLTQEKMQDIQNYLNNHPLENIQKELFPDLTKENLGI